MKRLWRRLLSGEGTSYGLPSWVYVQWMDSPMPDFRKPQLYGYLSFGYRKLFIEMNVKWIILLTILLTATITHMLGR